jgi:hypothetical protein
LIFRQYIFLSLLVWVFPFLAFVLFAAEDPIPKKFIARNRVVADKILE